MLNRFCGCLTRLLFCNTRSARFSDRSVAALSPGQLTLPQVAPPRTTSGEELFETLASSQKCELESSSLVGNTLHGSRQRCNHGFASVNWPQYSLLEDCATPPKLAEYTTQALRSCLENSSLNQTSEARATLAAVGARQQYSRRDVHAMHSDVLEPKC